ncbi:MAG: glycosyltransferase, partial [Alphaproteobacteria bacterium]
MGRARLALGTRHDLRRALLRSLGGRVLRHACDGLASRFPGESAHSGMTRAQRAWLGGLTGLLGLGAIGAPALTLHALAIAATLFFACVVMLRLTACIHLALLPPATGKRRLLRIPERELPVYTVLVPLFREAAVLPALISALKRLDYPAAKLDIKLIFESVDDETYASARALELPGNFDLIVVPDAQPRTKPKALNYALQFARGEFAVIYDAEDRPEPDQLRKAVARFRQGPPNLACLQARLNFYNADENWLTRQFALEYSALFDGLLPTLERLDLPIPLGGTSNHFRIAALRWLGAWDAYNVTEDADLGMRLYRHGYLCRMLDSTTHEEAVCRFLPWLRQRTRWLKGYLQTYFVHMRHPWRLWRELGARRFLGFQLMIGGVVFSALAHPLFYGLLGLEAARGGIFAMPATILHL